MLNSFDRCAIVTLTSPALTTTAGRTVPKSVGFISGERNPERATSWTLSSIVNKTVVCRSSGDRGLI